MNPFYKKSHSAYYVNRGGKQIRLGKTLEEANAKMVTNDLQTLVQRFLDHYRKDSTRKTYQAHLQPFLKLGLTVARLKPYHLTRLLDDYDGNYKHNIAKAVKTCFKWLCERGYVHENPFVNIKTPPEVSRGDEAYIPAAKEKVAQATGDLQDILTLLLETGCRPQEARHMEAHHYRDGTVVFSKRDSKGNLRQRVIRLSTGAREIVLRRIETFPTGPIFLCGNKPWTATSLNDACKPFGFTPYQVRHTFATNALTKGVDIVTIAQLMGHASTRMLTKVYQHVGLLDGHMQDAIERINA